MEQSFEEKLLGAIKKDDLKAFNALLEETKLGNLRLGRFPVLSLLYLYGSRKILSAYEFAYLKISSWDELAEPAYVAELFASKAGKCLRLYFDEVVSPVEMLLILDKTGRAKKAYPVAKPSEAIRKRLKAIYNIKYALGVTFRGNNIVLDRRPLNRREKKRLALACIGCLLILAIIIAVPVTATQLLPNRAAGEVSKLKHIDFASRETYTVVRDIVIPDGFTAETVNCNIKGGGGRLIFGKGATLGQFNGTLSDIEVVTSGSPIFDTCTNLATIQNVTVTVDADVDVTEQGAFVALTSYGVIENVRLNVKGRVRAVATGDDSQSVIMGGIVASNVYAETPTYPVQYVYGVIRNCSANYDVELSGDVGANASFGGVAGVNRAKIENCVVSGNITSDTFDLGGACYLNCNSIVSVINKANLTSTASAEGWTTVVAGVAIESRGANRYSPDAAEVRYCKNEGDLSATSAGDVIAGGIVANAYGRVEGCLSDGDVYVKANSGYVGGIIGRMEFESEYSVGVAEHCAVRGKLTLDLSDDTALVGGIVGFVRAIGITVQEPDMNGGVVTSTYFFGGGVKNCVFAGEKQGEIKYFGNIVGAPSAELYDNNDCFPSEDSANFAGNIYVQNGAAAFGAKIITVGEGEERSSYFEGVNGDKGAKAMSKEDALASQLLKDILAAFADEEESARN